MPVVEFEKQDHVALITLNRPEARNALNPEVMCRLADAWNEVQNDDEIRVAVVTGAGTVFCAGADLGRGHGPLRGPGGPAGVVSSRRFYGTAAGSAAIRRRHGVAADR